MEQTITNATEDFLKSQIKTKEFRITQLEEQIQTVTQRSYTQASELQTMRDAMHEFTMEQLEEEALTEFQAGEIASICNFELSKEIDVEINVVYNLTLSVPHGTDVESVINDIDFDSVQYGDEITYLSSMIEGVNF
jgi:hypothetical protein